jgi:hypothetical protein
MILAGVLLAACSARPAASPETDRSGLVANPPPVAVVPPIGAPVVGEVPPELMAAVRAELGGLIGVERADSATVLVAESVIWPDSSLGCPRPGEMYLQVLTPGYRVVLEADGTHYDYRLSEAGVVRLCERPLPVAP